MYDELSESVVFGENIFLFKDKNEPKAGAHENEC